jgi:hypothetical protein
MEQHIYEQRQIAFQGFYYLPLFYLIPYDIAHKRKLADFPRDPYVVVTDETWRGIYHSLRFQVTVTDTWAWMMWQCLGIRGGIDNYSHNDPIIRMVYELGMWVWLLSEMGITTEFLASYPPDMAIPFLTMEQAAHNCDRFAEYFWNHPELKMREVYEIVRTHRDHRDYSGMRSHVKIDFRRKYYHTRTKIKIESIISGYDDEGDEEIVYAPYQPDEFAEVELRMWFAGFLKHLNAKDNEIIRLLEEGYTQEEIAVRLGYSSHSGVSKRIKFIRNEFEKFRQK